ncbi:MAG TPA: protein phosphatase 2C domain-containing protein [Acidimicrobiia bacterium]
MTTTDDHTPTDEGNGTLRGDGVLSKLSYAFRSEPGPVRETNEDYAGAFALTTPDDAWDRGPLFLVADGMGGHAAGEVASSVAVEAALQSWARGTPGPPPQALRSAVRTANIAVYDAALAPGRRGMGTTVVGATLAGREAIVGHVGDSRAYLVRGDECLQLTADHSRVGEMVRMRLLSPEEAAQHPARSQLTRSLGAQPGVQVDLTRQPIETGDALVLCTDGLWDLVARAEMADAFATSEHPTSAPALTDAIVDLAIKRGASDNVTAAVIVVTSTLPIPAAAGRRLFRRGRS